MTLRAMYRKDFWPGGSPCTPSPSPPGCSSSPSAWTWRGPWCRSCSPRSTCRYRCTPSLTWQDQGHGPPARDVAMTPFLPWRPLSSLKKGQSFTVMASWWARRRSYWILSCHLPVCHHLEEKQLLKCPHPLWQKHPPYFHTNFARFSNRVNW